MNLNYFPLCLATILISFVTPSPSPTRTKTERNFSFAIPAFLLGGGGGLGIGNVNPNAPNNGNLPNINTLTSTNQLDQNQLSNLNFGTNLFRQVTVTRTILSTVAIITAPVFRTCTVTPANFAQTPCAAGRRKRSADGDQGEEPTNTLEMILVMGSTTVSDQSMASKILHLEMANNETHNNGSVSTLTSSKGIDLATLFPSEDVATSPYYEGEASAHQSSDPASSDTPALTNVIRLSEEVIDQAGHARINLGGTVTVTRTLPVTGVINSTVTAGGMNNMLQALTISYMGCSPPQLPVTGTPCV